MSRQLGYAGKGPGGIARLACQAVQGHDSNCRTRAVPQKVPDGPRKGELEVKKTR